MKSLRLTGKTRVLLINDDVLIQKSVYELLCRYGYKVEIAETLEESLAHLEKYFFHIILIDINKSKNHVDTLNMLREKTDASSIIILTSSVNLEMAVQSIKLGAFDYLVRPIEDKKIISTIERALLTNRPIFSIKEKEALKKPKANKNELYYGIVGKSQRLNDIYSLIDRISNSKATVLLRGESGTGKRLLAHSLHKADKKRRHKPFIEVSCGALPSEIIESELFGHTKGAFTGAINDRKGRFELAHGGTILLDDIDSLSLDLQVKLLRVLQQKEFERVGDHKTMKVDVRIVTTTNQDLEKLIAEKKFREDLYYRLNVISITMPPLRERKEDLPLLIEHFVELYAKENQKKMKGISDDAVNVLTNYDWPGNVRELENIIERGVILDTDFLIDKNDLPEIIIKQNTVIDGVISGKNAINMLSTALKDVLQEPEKVHILRVLKEVGYNKKKAANKLGVNRTTLYNKLKKYNIITSKME